MIDTFKKKNWNSVGLEAVHCAISAADALMIYSKGMRCASEDHKDSVEFIEQNIERREVKQHLNQFRAIIGKKNLIEYEERSFSEKEAEEVLKRAERFLNWVKEQLR
jgi:HEPN domain-containing protein